MERILTTISSQNTEITLAAVGLSFVALLLWMINYWRISRMLKKYKKLTNGLEGQNFEEILETHMDSVNKALAKTREVESYYRVIKKMAENSVQHVGLVRFNAFSNTGSDLSFAVALLDHHGDGIVFSSIYGREESHVYAKPVSNGVSNYNLSDEEKEAIKKALGNNVIR